HSIDIIFPTHDSVVELLSNIDTGSYVINAFPNTAQICRSKIRTYNLFIDEPWCPSFTTEVSKVSIFPVISKPDIGHGGQGIQLVKSKNELMSMQHNSSGIESHVFVEYLPGDEATVDCFTDYE